LNFTAPLARMSENFARELVKVVIGQITQGMGFHSIQQSACDTLSDILTLYMEEIGYSSHLYAEHASRVESNYHDINRAFEDLGVSIQDLHAFATQVEELPFPKAVPKFPLPKKETPRTPELREPEEPLPPHIPPFLPPFPDRHTYAKTPIYTERITDPRVLRRTKSKQKRQLEKSLYDLSTTLGVKPVASYEALKHKPNPYTAPPKTSRSTHFDNDIIMTEMVDIAPTPITDLSPYYDVLSNVDEAPREEEKYRNERPQIDLDDSERAKKRAKVEKILNLSHQDGIVDSLEPGLNDKDGE